MSETIKVSAVTDMVGRVPDSVVQEMLEAWRGKDAGKIERVVSEFIREGYSGTQLLMQVSLLNYK
jgi:DNA polymerase III gamma/tau subunit